MKNLDHAFDEYLKSHEAQIIKSIPEFANKLNQSSFKYGRFTIPAFYKAHFLNTQQIHLIKRVASTLGNVINQATRLYMEEGHLSHIFDVTSEEVELINIDPGYSKNVVLSRFDSLLEGQSLKLVELNCDAPAGAAYGDFVENAFMEDAALKDFFDEENLVRSSRIENLLKALLETYEEFGGYETPNIAIVDWKFARTTAEFALIKQVFEEKGYKTTIADPRELVYKSGSLYHKNMKINIVYRRALFDELMHRIDEVQDLIKAYKEHAICMVNPLRSRIASTKALLSVLTNPDYDHYFTENENQIKSACLPWTRRISDAKSFYGGNVSYLIDFLKDEKETIVLKPSRGNMGRDVILGRETPESQWNEAIGKAMKNDWVVQEYVNIPIMTVPEIINQKIDFAYKKYNFNLLVFGEKYAGGFTRLSSESVINVATGGGLVPALASEEVLERRFNV
jgi:uncharacterized circularly permuted ATP-grasp superfamily protein